MAKKSIKTEDAKRKLVKKKVVKKAKEVKQKKDELGTWLDSDELNVLSAGGFFDHEGVLHNGEGCARCTSMVKSTGRRCKNFAVPGELYCNIHGGTLQRVKNGKRRLYSLAVQDPTLAAVLDSMNDDNEEITGLEEELRLLRLLVAKLLRKKDLEFSTKELKDFASVIGEIRNLVDSCTKTSVRLGRMVSIEKIEVIVKQLETVIRKYVPDQVTLEKIAYEFRQITMPNAVIEADTVIEGESVRQLPEETS